MNKFVIVGGGATHTPGIIAAMMEKAQELKLGELVLYDIDEERVRKMGEFTRIYMGEHRPEVKVSWTTDIAEAFTGADFLFVQIRPGGFPMRELDEKIPLRNGIVGQETCGLGGMAFALRMIPAIREIFDRAQEICPDAWILNYSNPEAIISEMAYQLYPKAKIFCICDMPIAMEEVVADILGIPLDELTFSYFGLNHFGWFTHIYDKSGKDWLPVLRDGVREGRITEITEETEKNDFKKMVETFMLFPECLPTCYLSYYLFPDEMVAMDSPDYTRANFIMDHREKDVFAECDKVIAAGSAEGSALVAGVHGNYIVDIACSIIHDRKERFVVNVKNEGAIANFDADAVVEVPCYVGAAGLEKTAVGEIPTFCKALMEMQKGYEKLVVEAALTHSYGKALQAVMLNKTVPSYRVGKKVLDELMEANRDYWEPLS